MQRLNVDVQPDVPEFVWGCHVGVDVIRDPVPTLIYGRFRDEHQDGFRIALCERGELSVGPSGEGFIYEVPGLKELYVPHTYLSAVTGKVLGMSGDVLVLRHRE